MGITAGPVTLVNFVNHRAGVTASIGVVTFSSGVWNWTYNGTDDLATTTVTITATDDDGEPLNENADQSGDDLDVPGSEDDDANELTGEEDEENNSYSLNDDKEDDINTRQ